jgi:phosphotriesterase-related protein
MKRIFTILAVLSVSISVFCQVPEKMSYQAVVRNESGELIKNSSVGMQVSILQGSATGTPVYVETQTATTNDNGLVTIEIGGGTSVTGTFAGIDWSAGVYFLKTETDPTGGTNYTITGTSQLISVPYALYAKKTENIDTVLQKLKDLEDVVYTQLLPPTNGLVAYFPFNGNANDESGNGYNGTVSGATLTNDRFGRANKAYLFTAANGSHITTNSSIGNFGVSNFTISVWVKRNSAAGYEIFTQRSTPYRTSSWWELGWGSFCINENLAYQSSVNINVDDTLRNNVWYHFVGVREAATVRFYLNGLLLDENTTPQILNIDNLTNTEIGCNFSGSPLESFDGIIDDIRLYNRALYEPEIRMIYNERGYPDALIGDINDNTYNTVDWEGKVMTVHGLIPADSMGITLPHEHLLIVHKGDSRDLTDEALAITELGYYVAAGGKTLTEATAIGIGRNPEGLKRISTATGCNVIMSAGYYKDKWIPDSIKSKSTEQLTDIIINDIKKGIKGIHAGFIKIGTSRPITAFEEKSLRAAARAQIATGAAIDVHFDINGPISERHNAMDILESEGADLTRVYVSHCTVYDELVPDYITLAQRGCYIAFDNLGMEIYWAMAVDWPDPLEPAETIKALIDAGYLNQILVSQDVCFTALLVQNGGYGYAHILNNLVPVFLAGGITADQIHTIMVENPKRLLAFKIYTD